MPISPQSRKGRMALSSCLILLILMLIWFYGIILPLSGRFNCHANEHTLQQVHILINDGPSTPFTFYPNDPIQNQSTILYDRISLAKQRKRHAFHLGNFLRSRYWRYICKEYSKDILHAQSTALNSSQMTLQVILASWFAPKGTNMEWTHRINWQPMPYAYERLEEDNLLLVSRPCPRYEKALEEVLNTRFQNETKLFKNLTEGLENHTGMRLRYPKDIQSLYFTLLTEADRGYKLPAWTTDYFPHKIQSMVEQSYINNVFTKQMQKIKAGPWYRRMLKEMLNRKETVLTESDSHRKVFLYVGQDSTTVNILHALSAWNCQVPHYLAMVIFELHRKPSTEDYYIELYFRPHKDAKLEQIKIPGCQFQCPLTQFIHLTQNLTDSEQTCTLDIGQISEP